MHATPVHVCSGRCRHAQEAKAAWMDLMSCAVSVVLLAGGSEEAFLRWFARKLDGLPEVEGFKYLRTRAKAPDGFPTAEEYASVQADVASMEAGGDGHASDALFRLFSAVTVGVWLSSRWQRVMW